MYYTGGICMPLVSLRVTDQEKEWMESYAKLQGINLSVAIKKAFFERLEDEYDINIILDYEKTKDNTKLYSLEEAKDYFGIE